MSNKAIKICGLFMIMVVIACGISGNQIEGVYVAKNLVNNVDTLKILSDGTYIKDLYRKDDNSLIYHNTGKWKYEEGRITLYDFLLDEDKPYNKEFNRFEDVLITSSLVVKRRFGTIVIYYRQRTDDSYYEATMSF